MISVSLRLDELIGHNVRRLRVPLMTQAELGARIGSLQREPDRSWSKQAVSQAERGLRPFRAVDLYLIAAALDTTLQRLLTIPNPSELDALAEDDGENEEIGEVVTIMAEGMDMRPRAFEQRTGKAVIANPDSAVRAGVQAAFAGVNAAQTALAGLLQTLPQHN